MTQAQFNNLSAAEKEGLIYISDAAGQLTASEVALAAIAGMSATTVQSGIAELKSLIGSIGRTVTTLANDTGLTISAGNTKTYATLTTTALTAYDEVRMLIGFGNVFVEGSTTKAQISEVANYSGGGTANLYFCGRSDSSINYQFSIRTSGSGLILTNRSSSININSILIEGIKYN